MLRAKPAASVARPLILSSYDEVWSLLDWDQLLSRLRTVMAQFSASRKQPPQIAHGIQKTEMVHIAQPIRSWIEIPQHSGSYGVMPCFVADGDLLSTKVVSSYAKNPTQYSLPSHNAWVMLFDGKTGVLKAMLEGASITAKRTAAASALATETLSNKTYETLAILGSGVQARSHLEVHQRTFGFKKINLWNYQRSTADKLKEELQSGRDQALYPEVEVFENVQDAVKDADVICTVTMSTSPVLLSEWVTKKDVHINAVGAPRPTWQELSADLMNRGSIYVDTEVAARHESGDLIMSGAEIYAELGEVFNKTKEARWKQLTIFKNLGMAIEDAVSADIIFQKYHEKN